MVASLAVTLTLLLVLKFSANLVSSLAHFIILSYSKSTYSLQLACEGELCEGGGRNCTIPLETIDDPCQVWYCTSVVSGSSGSRDNNFP